MEGKIALEEHFSTPIGCIEVSPTRKLRNALV